MPYHFNYTARIPTLGFISALLLLSCCYVLTTYASIYNQELYVFLLKEDGPLENIATASVLLAAFLFFFAYFKSRNSNTIIFLLFSAVLFLLFMEELSWGQRIFGFQTPEIFEQANAQKEINLHNYSPIYKYVNKVMYAGLQFYMVGIVLLILIYKNLHTSLIRLKIPIPSPATAFLMCANYFLFTDFFLVLSSRLGDLGSRSVNYVELFEAGIEISLLFFAFECFIRGITWMSPTITD